VEDDDNTLSNRYNPDDDLSRDTTENLNRNKLQRKSEKSHRSQRNSRMDCKQTYWHGMYKDFWLRNQELILKTKKQ
jgi:hypothetical protein